MQLFRYPASASVSISSQGQNGDPAPLFSLQVGGEDPSGDLQPLQVNGSGELIVTIGSGIANPLPVEDAAAEASLASIDGKLGSLGQKLMAGSAPVVIASDQSTLPVSAASLPLPSGAATLAEQQTQTTALGTLATEATLSSIDSKTPALGQALMAASIPVAISSNQSTLPVSMASSPLPSGAATLAEQQAQTALLTTIDSGVGSIDTKTPALGQAAMAASVPVTIANDQSAFEVSMASEGTTGSPVPPQAIFVATEDSNGDLRPLLSDTSGVLQVNVIGLGTVAQETTLGSINTKTPALVSGRVPVDGSGVTQPISAASLPLPTGAATETTLAAINTKTPSLGQAAMAASSPVVLASDQSSIPVAATPVVPPALTVKSAGISVGTSAVRLTTDGSAPSSTRRVLIANCAPNNTNLFYIGDSSVTAGTGVVLAAGQTFAAENDAGDYYVICSAAAQTLYVTEQE